MDETIVVIGNQHQVPQLCQTIINLAEEIGEEIAIFTLAINFYNEAGLATQEDWDDLLEELMPLLYCVEQQLQHEVDADIVFDWNEDNGDYRFTYIFMIDGV